MQCENPSLHANLLAYRNHNQNFTAVQISELLLETAKQFEDFIVELFGIYQDKQTSRQQNHLHNSIFEFKKCFVLRRARRSLTRKIPKTKKEPLESFAH